MSCSLYMEPLTWTLLGLGTGGFLNSTLWSTRNLKDNIQSLIETEQQCDVEEQGSVVDVDVYNVML